MYMAKKKKIGKTHKFSSISKGFNFDGYVFPGYKVVLFKISLGWVAIQ